MKRLILLMLIAAAPVSAQSTIIGHLITDDGTSFDTLNLDRVLSVKLYNLHGTYLSEAIPDMNGNFYFTNDERGTPLQAGSYTLRASGGFRLTKWVTVNTNTPITIKLVLNPVLLDGACSIMDGIFTCSIIPVRKLESVQRGPETLPLIVTADVIAPGLTSMVDARVSLASQRVNLGAASEALTFAVKVPPGMPSGFSICLDARVGADQWRTYRQLMVCATK